MSVFQLPRVLCLSINSMMNRFWWWHQPTRRSMISKNWANLSKSKQSGGMGFRDLEIFNRALLAKQGWWLIQNPDSLVVQIMKEKYYTNSSFVHANLGSNPLYAWRSIFNSREMLKQGLIWRVGNGKDIKIWGDKWLPTSPTFQVQSRAPGLDRILECPVLLTSIWVAGISNSFKPCFPMRKLNISVTCLLVCCTNQTSWFGGEQRTGFLPLGVPIT
jgi:hypothetical protein